MSPIFLKEVPSDEYELVVPPGVLVAFKTKPSIPEAKNNLETEPLPSPTNIKSS
jgi:hypothetical protein